MGFSRDFLFDPDKRKQVDQAVKESLEHCQGMPFDTILDGLARAAYYKGYDHAWEEIRMQKQAILEREKYWGNVVPAEIKGNI